MASGRERLLGIFCGMKTRCYNKNRKDYSRYGGRGITVCNEWMGKNGFKLFFDWAISHGYNDSLTLDRIDGNGSYSPGNCRWATPSEQCRNRSNNHLIEYNGEVKTLKEWADIAGIRKDTFRRRLVVYGWTVEDAINTPSLKGKGRVHHRHG